MFTIGRREQGLDLQNCGRERKFAPVMDDYVLIVLIVACLLLFFSTCLLAVSRRRSIIKKTQLQRQISSQDEGALRAARIEPSELAVHELLGRGSFGEVSRATWRARRP